MIFRNAAWLESQLERQKRVVSVGENAWTTYGTFRRTDGSLATIVLDWRLLATESEALEFIRQQCGGEFLDAQLIGSKRSGRCSANERDDQNGQGLRSAS